MYGLTPYRHRGMERLPHILESFLDPQEHFGFRTDIRETDDAYILQAEIPGVSKDGINVDIDGEYLTISVNADNYTEEENDNFIRKERFLSSASRSFHLGEVKQEEITARYNDGILEVKVPKKHPGQTRRHRIEIH